LLGKPAIEIRDEIKTTSNLEQEPVFVEEERNMVRGALMLAERTIKSIMTLRSDISWINLNDKIDVIHQQLLETPHSFLLVCRDNIDNLIGIARAKDLIADAISKGNIDEKASLKKPIVLHENWGVIKAMDILKRSYGQLLVVVDEYGEVKGLVTPIDVLEAIAGEFPDEDEQLTIQQLDAKSWKVDGVVDLYYLEQTLGIDFPIDNNEYVSLAGFLLTQFNRIPGVGDSLEFADFRFEVIEMDDRRVAFVMISKIEQGNK
ncbi:MAG: HlyC/CorC family transporter, partial [Legionella longbeachae]|nr:HlyC/CorC family transporter [Legionella longbeachae]